MYEPYANSYLWRRALALSGVVSLLVTVLVLGVNLYRSDTKISATAAPGKGSEPFAAVPKEDLEAVYRKAWLAVRQNYLDEGKLAAWQEWEHKFDGRIRTEQQLVEAVKEMLASLADKHTIYISARQLKAFEQSRSGKFVGIGVGLNDSHGIVNVIANTPAEKAGLKAGDVIAEVDGVPTGALTTAEMITLIRGQGVENTTVALTIIRQNQPLRVTVKREVIKREPAVRSYTLGLKVEGNSIRIDNLRGETVVGELAGAIDTLKKAGAEALVLDLRGVQGGSGLVAAQVAALFLTDGPIAGGLERADGTVSTTGYEIKGGKLTVVSVHPHKGVSESAVDSPVGKFEGAIVVLIDERTSGAAEIIAAVLKERARAAVVGVKSAGKGTGQMTYYLTGRHVLRITSSRYLTAGGKAIDGVGVTPDLAIAPGDHANIFYQGMLELKKRAAGK